MGGRSQPQQAPDYTGIGLQTSAMSLPVPLAWGLTRGAPNLIDYEDFKVHKHSVGKGFGGKGTQYTYSATIILALSEGPVTTVTRTWVNQGSVSGFSDKGFSFFGGTTPQSPWGYMVTNHPSKARSYQGICYLAAANYDLGQSEAVPAHNFEFQAPLYGTGYTGAGDADCARMVDDFLTNDQYGAFFPSARIDSASLLSSGSATTTGDSAYQTYCRAMGFGLAPFIGSQESAITILGRWMQITNSVATWTGYSLKFIPYGDATVTGHGVTYLPPTGSAFNLGDNDYIQESDADPVIQTRADVFDAYNAVVIECRSRADDYNTVPIDWIDQSQTEIIGRRQASPIQAHEICVPAMAFKIVSLLGQRLVYIRDTYQFKLGPEFTLLEPMDCGFITDTKAGIISQPVRIKEIEEQDDGNLLITAEEFPGTTGQPSGSTTSPGSRVAPNSQVVPDPINTPILFEPNSALAALLNGGSTAPLVVAIVSGGAGGVADPNWGGAIPNVSSDATTYGALTPTITGPARQGLLTANLAAYGGANPDNTHTLSVTLAESAGTLQSASSSADAAAGATLCYVDGEIIGFTTATLTGTNTYNLTGLYRGLYGTTPGSHLSGTKFGRLDSAIFVHPLPAAYIGTTLYFKFQSFNIWSQQIQDISTCTAYPFTPTGTGYGGGSGGVPKTPTGLTATPGVASATMAWNANAAGDNVTIYKVFRAPGTGASFGSAVLVGEPGNALTWTDNSLSPVTGYTYFLEAANIVGASAPTSGVNLTTGAASLNGAGFGFEAEGLLLSNEDLGVAAWPTAVTFSNSNPDSYLIAAPGSPATADAVFRFMDASLAVLGTFTVPAGARFGVLAWAVDPYVHPANTQMFIRGPATADATLATVNCMVAGTRS